MPAQAGKKKIAYISYAQPVCHEYRKSSLESPRARCGRVPLERDRPLRVKKTQKLHSDARTPAEPAPRKRIAVVRQWLVRSSRKQSCGIDETRQHNSTSALNIVVENGGVAVAEGVKVFKGVIGREILI